MITVNEQNLKKLKRTPLYEAHKKLGARIVDFAGWEMPVLYSGIIEEHRAVRNSVGIFDVSHMGEIEIVGREAVKLLQFLTVNDVTMLNDNECQYSMMCYPDGGIVDDILVYRLTGERFMLCVNASNADKDYQWILKSLHAGRAEGMFRNAEVKNVSDNISQISIQGKNSEPVLQKITGDDLSVIKHNRFVLTNVDGVSALVSRTGYTGEDGFEIYLKNENAERVWNRLLEIGKEYDIKPVGLGARDTLRLEMKYPLYGNDISEKTTPLEAGLSWVTKFDKGNFMGRESLLKQKDGGLKRKLIGFEMIDKGIPRSHYSIFKGAEQIGEVTSGTMSPSLNKAIGVGYVKTEISNIGNEIEINIRGSHQKAKIVSTPFYKSGKIKQ
ncbi:MAG TPA: glycine cleavage system aminomethyltransferase GcvT [Nitrospinae bacterium]|nr:glycine cleavage system aminomethyltransferase GcvT [Nitrospinota bacterium]HBA26370.1 glycine cleavage system aminomethyltransferase GcvT [Nitrospinota bacterium]